jgi:LysR family transcriptional regulator, positive regulator for ilvC
VNHKDLQYFVHLARSLHFGKSAAALHVSPSALTRSVQRLEDELGEALLLRDRRHVSLTTAGERLRRFASEQLAAWEALKLELSQRSPAGRLRVACTVTACYSVLPRVLARCRSEYPQIAIKLITQDAARSMQQLKDAQVDLAVVPLPEELPAGLRATTLGETELVFIAPVERAEWTGLLDRRSIPWAQIPLVAPLGGLERSRLDTWLHQRKASPTIYAEVRGNEGIIAMVSMGCGIGLVPELVLQRSPQADRVKVLSGIRAPPGYQVGLCVKQRTLGEPAVRALWELAQGDQQVA